LEKVCGKENEISTLLLSKKKTEGRIFTRLTETYTSPQRAYEAAAKTPTPSQKMLTHTAIKFTLTTHAYSLRFDNYVEIQLGTGFRRFLSLNLSVDRVFFFLHAVSCKRYTDFIRSKKLHTVYTFSHLLVCLTADPYSLPRRILHSVQYRAHTYNFPSPLVSLRSSSRRLRRLPRLPITSSLYFPFKSLLQFLRTMCPILLAFLSFYWTNDIPSSLTVCNTASLFKLYIHIKYTYSVKMCYFRG
jgi:hypothetical protein